MKTEERAVPELVQATRDSARPRRATGEEDGLDETDGEPVEISDGWVEEMPSSGPVTAPTPTSPSALAASQGGGFDPAPADRSGRRRVTNNLKTAEINIDRDRRATLSSPIPAMLAEWMRKEAALPDQRDPAAPEKQTGELTRRIGDSEKRRVEGDASAGYTVEVVNDNNADRRKRAAHLIDRARAFVDAGALRAAAGAAEAALCESDQATAPGIVEVIEPARPMIARILAGFVGPLTEVPVLARRAEDLDLSSLDERSRAVISRVDGSRTLGQIFDDARVPVFDALRLAACLMRDGVIRVI